MRHVGQETLQYQGDIFGPGTVATEMDAVDSQVRSIVKSAGDNPDISQKTRDAFAQFAIRWRAFYTENRHGLSGLLARTLNTTRLATADFRNQLHGWQSALEREGLRKLPKLSKVTMGSPVPWRAVAAIGGAALLLYFIWGIRRGE